MVRREIANVTMKHFVIMAPQSTMDIIIAPIKATPIKA